MAVIGTLTLEEILIFEIDADPSINGLEAPSGSLAIMTDGSGIFHKGEGNQYDWIDHSRVVPDVTKEPTGFVNRTDSVLSFDETTRIFTISPTNTSFDIYIKGKKLSFSSPLTVTISDVDQGNFIYIDANGQLIATNTFSTAIFSEGAYIAYLLWDAEDNKAIVFGEERHGLVMDSATHLYLHTTRGSQLNSGGAVSYSLGDGSANSHAQIGLSDMVFSDEDIRININHSITPTNPHEQILNGIAHIPLYYRSGASGLWKKLSATEYPIKFGTIRAQYNQYTGSTWQLNDATTDNKYLVSYIFATNNFIEPVVGVIGQAEYNDLGSALAEGKWSSLNVGTMPLQEFKLLYRVIYKTNSTFTNAVKSAIEEVTDLRFGTDREISTIPLITDHGNLSGLTDDDHLQYHNDIRGDIRYYTKTLSDTNYEPKNTNIQTHISNVNNPHNVTKSQIGLENVPNTDATLRSNHTGTQLASTISDFTIAVQNVSINADKIDGGQVSNTEFSYLSNVTSDIQTQIDSKQPTGNYITTLTGDVTASGPGSSVATLSNTGIIAGTYSQVTVDSKGRVTAGTNNANPTIYKYTNTSTASNTNATYTSVAQLTTGSLPIGLYKFSFDGLFQSANANSGIGIRVGAGTATLSTCYGEWRIKQAADGVNSTYEYSQLNATTNITSVSVPIANTNFKVTGSGVFRVTVAGTVAIQIRGETNGTAATLQTDSSFIIQPT